MWRGKLEAIYISREHGRSVVARHQIRAVPGKGLEGDRYYHQNHSSSKGADPESEVTLIEAEVIEALRRDHQINLGLGDSRRNLVTRGVPLNHLVGKEFQVGEVRLRGIRLCEPCSYLANLTQKEVLPALVHRGGLRAQILTESVLRVGDVIIPVVGEQQT